MLSFYQDRLGTLCFLRKLKKTTVFSGMALDGGSLSVGHIASFFDMKVRKHPSIVLLVQFPSFLMKNDDSPR